MRHSATLPDAGGWCAPSARGASVPMGEDGGKGLLWMMTTIPETPIRGKTPETAMTQQPVWLACQGCPSQHDVWQARQTPIGVSQCLHLSLPQWERAYSPPR